MESEIKTAAPNANNSSQIAYWDYTCFPWSLIMLTSIFLAFVIFKCVNSNAEAAIFSKCRSICSSIAMTVGMIGITVVSACLEQYLKVLASFHVANTKQRKSEGAVEPSYVKISYRNFLQHLTSAVQRALTYKAAYAIVRGSGWSSPLSGFVLSLILFPRLLFSLLVVRCVQDMSCPQPNDPNRKVNLSLRLLHYVYKGFRQFFEVLSGLEALIYFLGKQIQFTTMQLLGYSYNNKRILIYSDVESIVFLAWSASMRSELSTDFTYNSAAALVVCLRLFL